MASGCESLSNIDLRKKLLEYGYDIPISVKKDFMLKTLEKAMTDKSKNQPPTRKSLPVQPSRSSVERNNSNNNHETESNASSHSRRSSGSGRASLPAAARAQPLQQRIKINEEIQEEDEDIEEMEEDIDNEEFLEFSLTQRTNNHSQASNVSHRQQVAEEEGIEEEEDEEEENRTPSPRYQKYLSYFKGDTKSESPDPFVMPRSRYSSPVGSPYSTAATMGSPSFRGGLSTFDDSGDESEAEFSNISQQSRVRFALNKVNPVNWMPNPKSWFARSTEYSNNSGTERETDNQNVSPANFNFGSGSVNVKGFPTPNIARPSTSSNALSGFNGNSSPRANLANQIYSPAQPPPPPIVPPQMAAARQAGFKSFFSRGERNGYGNVGPTDTPSDTAHLVPKILLLSFIVGILGVFGLYHYKISDVSPTKMLNEWGAYITSLAQSIFFFGLLTVLGFVGYKGLRWQQHRKLEEVEEMFALIDKVVELLHTHYEDSKNTGQEEYLAINQIRDVFFPPRERKNKQALWNKVVVQISTNESRIREEVQHLSGEEFRVWRWLPSASPLTKRMSSGPFSPIGTPSRIGSLAGAGDSSSVSPSGMYPNLSSMNNTDMNEEANLSTSQWQGQAFEIFDGCPNSLAQPPTTCLKIRQMYDSSKDIGDNRIEKAILEKCKGALILHIGIDRTREGCVYIRCLSKMDARTAYGALHGWWFDGHLLSVKFLREDRYLTRFPEATTLKQPLTPLNLSTNPSSPITSPFAGISKTANINNMRTGNNSQSPATPPRSRFNNTSF